MSRRRQHPARQIRSARRVSAGYGAQHACKEQSGTRETRLRGRRHGKVRSYKPKAKSSAAQRESEGIVVPRRGASRANERRAEQRGGREGSLRWSCRTEQVSARAWPARPDPTTPSGVEPRDKVRQLQRRLWAAAKRSPGRRFHALYDRIWRSDVLQEAWKRVKRNKGAAGVDAQTIADVEQHGVERFLEEIGAELRAGTYRPAVVLRRYIPKADGKKRPLGIPTVRDRVVQMAAKLVLEPIFEADFLSVLVRLPAEAERDDGAGDAAQARGHKAAITCSTPTSATTSAASITSKLMKLVVEAHLGSTGAQAGAAVARGRGDGRRRGRRRRSRERRRAV